MRIFVTGATGLVGRRLVIDRLERGDDVYLLARDRERAARLFAADTNPHVTVVEGDVTQPGIWQQSVDGCDAVVHLAGAGIADQRWTEQYKQVLRDSRVHGTNQVVAAIRSAAAPPSVFVCASAIGFYGDTGETPATEGAPKGHDFLADLCAQWEAAARTADDFTRVVITRFGVILDPRGGTLAKLLTPFRLFAGGHLGSGKQFISWVHYRDVIDLIHHAISTPDLRRAMNVTSPNPVRFKELARTLGKVMNRPAWLPVPRVVLRVVLGELAESICASQHILPERALRSGYTFHYPNLQPALDSLLNVLHPAANREARGVAALSPGNESSAQTDIIDEPAQPKTHARPPAPIRLAAIDVDGTLLRSDGSLAGATVEACRAASRAGCAIILATARPPRAMRPILRALDLKSPLICFNGALIWDAANNHPLHHQSLDAQTIRAIVSDARAIQPDIVVAIEQVDRWFTDQLDQTNSTEAIWLTEPDGIGPLDGLLDEPVTKLNFVGQPRAMTDVAAMLQHRYWARKKISLFLSDPRLIQVMHPLVDKGIALQRVARHLEIPRESVLAIGDAPNDMGMMEWAGFSVAVDNAPRAVRQLADVTVRSNNENGVARALQRFVIS